MGGQTLPTDEAIERADARHYAQMATAARMLNTQLGGMWPCGHHRNKHTTHTIGGVAQCKRCRRLRLKRGLRRAAELKEAVEYLGDTTADKIADREPVSRIVLDAVAEAFNITRRDLLGESRSHVFSKPRFMAQRLLLEIAFSDGTPRFSSAAVGRMTNRNHSSVLHAYRTCKIYCERDPHYRAIYTMLRRSLERAGFNLGEAE